MDTVEQTYQFATKQAKVEVKRYFSLRNQKWQTWVRVESSAVPEIGPTMSIEGAERLIDALQQAVKQAKYITPGREHLDKEEA